MRRILAALVSAAVLMGGCDGLSGGSTYTTPVLAPEGPSSIFGLRVNLDATSWQVLPAPDPSEFNLFYNPEGGECDITTCPTLMFATDSQSLEGYYAVSVKDGEFDGIADCKSGSVFDKAKKHEPPFAIAGELPRYYINPPCPGGEAQRFTWHFPERKLLIQYWQPSAASGISEVGIEGALMSASWE